MQKTGGKISLTILALVYLICSLRYFPGQLSTTLINTASHLLTVAPFLIGAILLFNSFYRRQTGARPPAVKILRIYLTMGIIIEFFIGLFHYLEINQLG